ncbi:MAG: ATP-dependent DNA ligase [Reyranellaceae bacterium]
MARSASTSIAMEARAVEALPRGAGWQYEPKWDGFRCLAGKAGGRVALTGRSGKSLARYFPDVVERLAALEARRFLLDGELIIPVDGVLSFEALQLRLHPSARRVAMLAERSPALLMAFDMLADHDGRDMVEEPLAERRRHLETFFADLTARQDVLRLSPLTRDRRVASRWLARAGSGALDGVVAKRIDAPYRAGERAMLKIKCLRTADCVVGGFRYGTGSREVATLLLGLYNEEGRLDHVGHTSGLGGLDRASLTRRLESLRGASGFTGDAPGGPSRWATERSTQWEPVRPKLVVEVQYDHVSGGRFRHGTAFVRWRPDKTPRQCIVDQLQVEAAPCLLKRLLG